MSSCCIPWRCSCQPLCRNYCSQLAQCGTFRIKVLSEHARVEERSPVRKCHSPLQLMMIVTK
jgi:hypothetical protein